jgi:hypothetical protein
VKTVFEIVGFVVAGAADDRRQGARLTLLPTLSARAGEVME